jgi:chromosome segregation and condensation protein ScpB
MGPLYAINASDSSAPFENSRVVNSQFMLRNLVMRGMIEKQSGSKDRNAGYVITADALRFLGVTDRDQLPHFEQFFQEIEKRVPTNNVTEE